MNYLQKCLEIANTIKEIENCKIQYGTSIGNIHIILFFVFGMIIASILIKIIETWSPCSSYTREPRG